jgi:hypothetical protein
VKIPIFFFGASSRIDLLARHDLLGRSSGRGSFLIWTHHMKNITFHASFSPTDASDSVTYDNVFLSLLKIQIPADENDDQCSRSELVSSGLGPTGQPNNTIGS